MQPRQEFDTVSDSLASRSWVWAELQSVSSWVLLLLFEVTRVVAADRCFKTVARRFATAVDTGAAEWRADSGFALLLERDECLEESSIVETLVGGQSGSSSKRSGSLLSGFGSSTTESSRDWLQILDTRQLLLRINSNSGSWALFEKKDRSLKLVLRFATDSIKRNSFVVQNVKNSTVSSTTAQPAQLITSRE